MYIVGFTGPIHHGKTSAAELLMSEEPHSKSIESWQVIAEVAFELNKKFDSSMVDSSDLTSINSWLFHLLDILPGVVNARPTFDQLEIREHEVDKNPLMFNKLFIYIDRLNDDPSLAEDKIEASNKEVYRPMLQWLGGYLASVMGETIWFNEIMRRVALANEEVKLYTISGLRFPADAASVRRHGGKIIEIVRPSYDVGDLTDPTESSRKYIDPDCLILNNGDLRDLEDVMKAVWQDIKSDRLRFEYSGVK